MARPRKNAAASRASLLPESALLPEIPVQEQPYHLPEGWKWVRLGDCNHYSGETINPALFQEDIFELYSVPSCITGSPEILSGKEIGSSKQSVEPEDVLLCKINPRINRVWRVVGYTANRLAASSEWIVFRNKDISSKYMMFCMQSAYFREYMLSNVSGVGGSLMRAQPKHVRRYPIPLPPREEQERIVGHIESLFARLDEARQKAEAVRDSVALRRAAILHKAFTGELTAKWREEQGISKESWKKFCFRELGECKLGKMLDKQKNQGKLTPYLRNINVRWFEFDLSDTAEMLATNEEAAQLSVMPGDLFICEGGEPGRCAVWKDKECNLIFQKALHRFRPNNLTISEFVCFYIKYLTIGGHLENFFTGTTIKHLTGQSLAKVPVILPTLPEQQEIVRILDDLLGREQRIREAADAVVAHIAHMKKAILARAFRGELGRADRPSRP